MLLLRCVVSLQSPPFVTTPKYHLTSYGCQMNKLDSGLVESKLRQRGYLPAASEAEAQVGFPQSAHHL